MKLYAPYGYWKMKKEQPKTLADTVNGAGPRYFGWMVPDTIYGLRITAAANIHDYMFSEFHQPWSDDEFHRANRIFLNNMHRLIQGGKRWRWLRTLRRARAMTYFKAVDSPIGSIIYWNGKNKPEEMQES